MVHCVNLFSEGKASHMLDFLQSVAIEKSCVLFWWCWFRVCMKHKKAVVELFNCYLLDLIAPRVNPALSWMFVFLFTILLIELAWGDRYIYIYRSSSKYIVFHLLLEAIQMYMFEFFGWVWKMCCTHFDVVLITLFCYITLYVGHTKRICSLECSKPGSHCDIQSGYTGWKVTIKSARCKFGDVPDFTSSSRILSANCAWYSSSVWIDVGSWIIAILIIILSSYNIPISIIILCFCHR